MSVYVCECEREGLKVDIVESLKGQVMIKLTTLIILNHFILKKEIIILILQ